MENLITKIENNNKKRLNLFIYSAVTLLLFILLILPSYSKIEISSITKKIWQPGKTLTVFFDIGQGDANLIITPEKHIVLIDCGPSNYYNSKTDAGQKILDYLKLYNINKIDTVIITHPHNDHIGGLTYLLKNIEIQQIYETGILSTSKFYKNILNLIKNKNIRYDILKQNQILNFGNKIHSIVLNAYSNLNLYDNKMNNSSIVLKTYINNKFTILYTGDIDSNIEQQIISKNYNIKSDILKIAHHGSKTSSCKTFLDTVNPKYSIISVGKFNRFNHPEKEVLHRLNKIKTKIFRTDINGNIEILFNNNNYKCFLQNKELSLKLN